MDAPQFKDLADLIGYLRNNLTTQNPREILERLHDLLGPDVIIRYEVSKPIEAAKDVATATNTATEAATDTAKNANGIEDAAKETARAKETIKGKYDHVDGKVLNRVLLASYRKCEKLSMEVYRQLNGLVLSVPGWKVLSVSAPILNYNVKVETVAKNLKSYDIYPVIDGTVVTLYWYEPAKAWRLSSSHGYDVTDMRWIGARTYMEALLELATQYNAFSLERLNRACSYTIGFRHPDFQPMKYDGAKVWFIQSCNTSLMNNLSIANVDISQLVGQSAAAVQAILSKTAAKPMLLINTTEDIGLPIQAPIQFPPDISDEKIVETLRKHNENALPEFTKSLSGDFVGTPHYGYFLRPKPGTDLCDTMFESTLLHLVKNALYNFPKKRHVGESELTPENRLEYAKLRAYLSNTLKYPFITLFPQFQSDYGRYDVLFGKIAERVSQIARKTRDKKSNDPRVELLAQKFAAHIKEKRINVANAEGMSIIMDFLRDRRYLELYFSVLVVGQ